MNTLHQYRARQVEAELEAYAEKAGVTPKTEGYLTAGGDMIADILHVIAARTGLPPADVLRACRSGISHFAANHGVSLKDHIAGDIGHESHVEIVVHVAGDAWTTSSSDAHLDDSAIPILPSVQPMVDAASWDALRSVIHEEFYEDLVGTADCGAFDGGCLLVARVIQQIYGGQLVVLENFDGIAEHAAVLVDGALIDYDGPLPAAKMIERFNKNEITANCVGFRPFQEGDLDEAFRDDHLERRLYSVMLDGVAANLGDRTSLTRPSL